MTGARPEETLPAIATEPRGVAVGRAWLIPPANLAEAMKLAEILAKSNFVPKDFQNRPGDVLCAVQFGAEIGLPPLQALQGIAVINGRPSVWGDAALAIVEASGLLEDKREWIEGSGDARIARCVLQRRGRPQPCERTFSVDDAKKAGLWENSSKDPWKKYPQRMLQMRARSWALRDEFSDVLKGLAIREEMEDVEPQTPVRTIELPRATGAAPASSETAAATPTTESSPAGGNGEQAANGFIDETERRRLFAECHKNGKSHKDLKGFLVAKGVDSTTAIPRALYADVLTWAQTPKGPAA